MLLSRARDGVQGEPVAVEEDDGRLTLYQIPGALVGLLRVGEANRTNAEYSACNVIYCLSDLLRMYSIAVIPFAILA